MCIVCVGEVAKGTVWVVEHETLGRQRQGIEERMSHSVTVDIEKKVKFEKQSISFCKVVIFLII